MVAVFNDRTAAAWPSVEAAAALPRTDRLAIRTSRARLGVSSTLVAKNSAAVATSLGRPPPTLDAREVPLTSTALAEALCVHVPDSSSG